MAQACRRGSAANVRFGDRTGSRTTTDMVKVFVRLTASENLHHAGRLRLEMRNLEAEIRLLTLSFCNGEIDCQSSRQR
jgi:hypothetical protein